MAISPDGWFELLPLGLLHIVPDPEVEHRVAYVNAQAARWLQVPPEWLRGQPLRLRVPNNLLWRKVFGLTTGEIPEGKIQVEFPHPEPPSVACWEVFQCGQVACPLYQQPSRLCWTVEEVRCFGTHTPLRFVAGKPDRRLGERCQDCRFFRTLPKMVLEVQRIALEEGVLISMYDVTALAELDRLKTQFISTISHELRTPLSVIRIQVDNLLKYHSRLRRDQRLEMLKGIQQQAATLQKMMEEIFTYARWESGQVQLERQTFDLVEVLQELLEEFRAVTELKGIRLTGRFPERLEIQADRVQIQQAVRNLLDNAVKFSPSGGEVEVEVRETEGNRVQIQVRDSGPGIPEEDLPHIFERFYRGQTTQQVPGTGLGLAIVQAVVAEHQGIVWAENRPEGGACFTIELPARQPSYTVLVVDDEELVRSFFRQILEQNGYRVEEAAHGLEALERLEAGLTPDLILTDLRMPRMDGYRLISILKANPQTRGIPIIAITAYDADLKQLQELGVQDFLSKPISSAALLGAVWQVLAGQGRRAR